MSDPLRVAAAVEGPTDAIVLRAVLDRLLADTEFEFQTLQPDGSAAFGSAPFARTGVGWGGVYRWARQSATEGGGSVAGSSVLSNHDLLIVHVDADVAGTTYSSASIRQPLSQDLPCERDCPPADDTTNALRRVVLRWLGLRRSVPQLILCTPSKNTEAWVVAAMWPDNPVMQRGDWECHSNPQGQLRALPRARRFAKNASDYRAKQSEIAAAWPSVSAQCAEAARFTQEFRAALPPTGTQASAQPGTARQDS